jgi:adenosylcobyric acid synthase
MTARAIMLQGTASHVGKSMLTAGLCRIFHQDGLNVAPFKAQNMSNNSYVTPDGKEIGRAQGVQALAAGIVPTADMNPILIKPSSDFTSQVVELGRPVSHMSWREYKGGYYQRSREVVAGALLRLQAQHEVLVLEGAGSPAEVNLKATDIVNMHTAFLANAPVLLAADIDRGGVFAHLIGTLECLDDRERAQVAGFIINKFRGDISLLKDGIDWLERRTGKPVFGVVPYVRNHGIEEEDAVSVEEDGAPASPGEIDIAVVLLPRMANFTDLDAFGRDPGTRVRWVRSAATLGRPDAIIIPGTKSTAADLEYLRDTGLADAIVRAARQGVPVAGVCGGYQMLGRTLLDPDHVESACTEVDGLGLLPVVTSFAAEKVTMQTTATARAPWLGQVETVVGYEIHMGRTQRLPAVPALLQLSSGETDGALQGQVWGTYLHGIFDNDRFRRAWVNSMRAARELPLLPLDAPAGPSPREQAFDRWAAHLRAHLDIPAIYRLLGLAPHTGV